jgi:ABC-type multidrug transport system permease subunit
MTIKNTSLSDRLNSFKNKQSILEEEQEHKEDQENYSLSSSLLDLFNSIIPLIVLFIKSFTFGYTLKLIFNTEWNFLGFLCIGLSINFIFQYINELFQNRNY